MGLVGAAGIGTGASPRCARASGRAAPFGWIKPSRDGTCFSAIRDLSQDKRALGLADLRKDVVKHGADLDCGWTLLLQLRHCLSRDGGSREICSVMDHSR